MHFVLVYLQPLRHNSPLVCAAAENREKITKTPFWGFKVIDVGTAGKLISSVMISSHVCAYVQRFLR